MSGSSEIFSVASAILDEMIGDLVLSTAMAAHREIKRGRVVCGTCGTKCRAHLPLPPSALQPSSAAPSRTSSPQPPLSTDGSQPPSRAGGYPVGPERGTGGSTGIGSGSGRMDAGGNVFFECLVCSRSIASNRYAPHLSSCLGLNGSTRRGAARSAAVKARLGSNNDRSSPSPYTAGSSRDRDRDRDRDGSENGDWGSDGDSVSGSKKRKMMNGSAKRGKSPSKVPMSKKAKLGSTSGSATPNPSFPRQALPPSKLGRPPTNRPTPSSPASTNSSPVKPAGGGGTTGRKTLPGASQPEPVPVPVPETIPGDESSEGADDDY
ncbi:hypothetical protein IAT40_003371 [Kwoniella sp. CBS 6097]